MTYQLALQALSDPTRQALIEALRAAPQPVGQLATRLPISRPAVSQHLKVLADAGLVLAEAQGNRRIYHLSPQGFADLRAYLDQLWDDALDAFTKEAIQQAGRSDS